MTRSSTPCAFRRTFAVEIPMSTLKEIMKGNLFGYTWRSRLIVLSVSLLFAVGSVALGLYLDRGNESGRKIFMPLFLVISFPIAQMVIRSFIIPKK